MTEPLALHSGTLLAALQAHAERTPTREAFRTLEGERWTWRDWWSDALRVAAGLVAAEIRAGDRVAILSANRPLWPIVDVGVMLAGAVSVGLYPTAASAQVEEVLADSGAVFAFTDGADQLTKLTDVRARLPRLRGIVTTTTSTPAGVHAWDAWRATAEAALTDPRTREALVARAAAVRPDADAILIYTSGSTGRAKGARLTHRTLVASAESVAATLAITSDDRSLSFLPFSHAGERLFGHATRVYTGMPTVLVPDASRVWEAAQLSDPTIFGGMPRFFEKAVDALRQAAASASAPERARWERAEALGRERSVLRQSQQRVPDALEADWREAVGVAQPVVRAHFGSALRIATSGGAAIPADVAETLDAFGVTVLGAYGQTEHLCGTMHRPDAYRFDSVGLPMPGTRLCIAADGEILFERSALTFAGYHGLPQETADAFTADEQWLRSGDCGELLPDGRLRVTGRKKEMIALSTGKKVAPLPIESALEAEPCIAQAVCVGEGRKYLALLVTPSALATRMPEGDVRRAIETAVARVNSGLSRSEQIKRWHLLDEEFTPEHGELTPTHKLRRAEIAQRHHDVIEALFD